MNDKPDEDEMVEYDSEVEDTKTAQGKDKDKTKPEAK